MECLEPRLALSGLNLTFRVENPNYNESNVYVTFIAGTLNATYDGGHAVALNRSYAISELKGPINLVSYNGGRIFVSLGSGVAGANPPEMVNPNIPSYSVRHDKYEITYDESNVNSVANLTAVDFFGIPLELNTYASGSTTPAQTLTYRIGSETLANELGALSGYNSEIVQKDQQGNFLRVLSPHTTPLSHNCDYASMEPYIQAVKAWQGQGQGYTTIEDLYSHLGSTPATQTQNYHFRATIETNGNLSLVGGGELVGGGGFGGSDHTVLIAGADLAQGIYLGNVAWTVDGQADNFMSNDVYAAAVRDALAGFNLGFMASETIDTNTGTAFGAESSKHWWSSPQAFEHLQPTHTYYNQYARIVTGNSDAYSWAFSDRWSHVQTHLHGMESLELVVLPDTSTSHASTAGTYDPAASLFYLRNTNTSGRSDETFGYGPPGGGWTPIVGDWTNVGRDLPGLYDPTSSSFYLKNVNTTGYADAVFGFGPAGGGWTPISGAWNGGGQETVGLYDPATSTFYLKNANTGGHADVAFGYGPAGAQWKPIVGDWNNDGKDTVGLYDPASSMFFLKDTNEPGQADLTFRFQPAAGTLTPVAGDWDGDGIDTVGLYDPSSSMFYLKNGNSPGTADVAFAYGAAGSGWKPLAGNWMGGAPLLAAEGAIAASETPIVTAADLDPIVRQAIAQWQAAGLDAASLARLGQVQIVVGDLAGSRLAEVGTNSICLDRDAAGHGWFIDRTPSLNEEFVRSGSSRQLTALDPQAVDRIDLQTVVAHELGHFAGFDHDSAADSLMSGTLGTGVRRSAY